MRRPAIPSILSPRRQYSIGLTPSVGRYRSILLTSARPASNQAHNGTSSGVQLSETRAVSNKTHLETRMVKAMSSALGDTPVAFISGHMDITQEQFETHYGPRIQEAVGKGHHFVLGDAAGTDTLALNYLLSLGGDAVKPRIKIYTSRPASVKRLEGMGLKVVGDIMAKSITQTTELVQGRRVKSNRAKHLERDARLTTDSSYDILWVRSEEESRALYGEKWRPRVSATELNRQRRLSSVEPSQYQKPK